ncbi:MAG: hypothetical protein HY736_00075 [Verrucomicrobia bacterium]|nr:hypothetical protein [Verrucomicrobiota bacterium]
MAGKTFQEMTLDEIFEFEKTHSFNIGHSGVTEEGFKRHQAKLAPAARPPVRRSKRRTTKSLVAAR